ncbi:MAG: O-phospho-L-seryl-tRNA:Cys-tRNA synthase [Halobacteriota archaeon]|nr:O-phospho-L-seryl-tRNA:Cys-tRNA synthase [Halobacteriota archaeon]
MDNRVPKLFEALFALEDIKEIFRQSLPSGLNDVEEKQFSEAVSKVESIIKELKEGKGSTSKYLADKIELRTREENFLNIGPIQAAGRLTPEARKAIIAYGDGYSVCDNCLAPFRLDHIKKPPISEFYEELAEFVGMDVARVIRGARNGFQIVANALLDKGDIALVSSVGHYSVCLAIESVGAVWKEIPLNERSIVTGEETARKIDAVKEKDGVLPKLVAVSHFDYLLGNEHDVQDIAKVCKDYRVPFLYNGAYTVGVMPVDGKKIGADFVVGSAHKSMASPAPSGVLATTDEFTEKIFMTTGQEGDITGRKFGIKETYLLGCTLMGAPLIGMMASFPTVKERIKNWDEEVKKSNFFIDEFLKVEGSGVVSEMPRKHTLTKVDTRNSFDTVAKTHKKKGYFFTNELKKRGITGIFPGATREYKLNVYGLSWDQIKYLADAFKDIAQKYGLNVSE